MARSTRPDRSTSQSREPQQWEDTSEPAQVGQRVLTGVFRKPVPLEGAPLLTNVVHWTHGTALGMAFGVMRGTRGGSMTSGLAFGAGAWVLAYAALGAIGLYEPIWKYPPKVLAIDFGRHAVYGLGTAAAYNALS